MIRSIKRECLLLSTLLAVAVLCSVSRLAAQEISLPNSPLDGQSVFIDKGCVKCHSIMGKGGKIGSDLAKVQASHSPAGIVAMMWNHVSDMRKAMEVWQTIPKLNESELANLVAYLFSISYFDEPGDAVRGKAVFERSGCQKCHQVGGAGAKIGPSLDKMKQYGSPLFLAQAMWNHGLGMSRSMERLGLKRPTFEGSEIADLLKYLHSVSHVTDESVSYMIPGSPKNGEKLFQTKGCINCHKIGGKGKSVGPDLTKKEFHRGATVIAGGMWNHGFMMWKKMKDLDIASPKLEGNEMADVISYLYFLEFQHQTGNPARGKELVEAKGCTNCHAIGGRGGTVGPALAQSQHFSNFITIAARMWNHNLDMQERMKESNIPFPRFAEHEMIDLLAYIRFQK
jgi:cytochrome c551/c552